jgi:MFS family permease
MLLFLPLGSFIGIPISGSLTTRHGSNKMLKMASILYPLALVNIGWAAGTFVWHLAIALFVFGMIGNLFNVSVNTQAVELAKLFDKSIISSFHGFWSLAGFVGGLIGSYFISASMTPMMQFLVILAIGYLFLFLTQQHLLHSASSKQSIKKMWTKPTPLMFQFGLIALSNMVCEGMMFDWSGVFYQSVVKVSESQRTIGYISFMACMTTGRMFADALINYWGPRKQLMLSGLLVTLGLVIAIIYPSIITSTIGFMLVGFGVSSVIPTIYGSVGKSAEPGQASIALASVSSIGFFGFLIGPPIVGFLSGALGLRWAFLTISLLGLVTFLQSYRLKKYL